MTEPRSQQVHIKAKPKGSKIFYFVSGSGGLNRLRIHAAIYTPERAQTVMTEIQTEHRDEYELKVVDAFKTKMN